MRGEGRDEGGREEMKGGGKGWREEGRRCTLKLDIMCTTRFPIRRSSKCLHCHMLLPNR